MKYTAPLQKQTQYIAPASASNKAVLNPLHLNVSANQSPLQLKPGNNPLQLQSNKENKTGLPNELKAGIENLSGFSMDDVSVHYNSNKPAGLDALAYAKGTDIHIAPGQEKHLPHEAWHVVQQKQGRVKSTVQMKGVGINDDKGLEKEADVMGEKALQGINGLQSQKNDPKISVPVAQRMRARLKKNEGREPTEDEIAAVTAQATANSEALAGHGRQAHGKRTEVPAARQQRQAENDRQVAIEQAIQLKAEKK